MTENFEIDKQISLLAQWWNSFKVHFPTADIVSIDNRNNSFTIKVRYDDIFRFYYREIKKQLPESKVFLKECDFSLYKMCGVVKYNKLITGWDKYNIKPEIVVDNEYDYLHYIPLEQLIEYFKQAWKEANKNNPMIFKFQTKHTDGIVWFYIKVTVPQRMGSTTTLIPSVGERK